LCPTFFQAIVGHFAFFLFENNCGRFACHACPVLPMLMFFEPNKARENKMLKYFF
jgi:hypothetical protein